MNYSVLNIWAILFLVQMFISFSNFCNCTSRENQYLHYIDSKLLMFFFISLRALWNYTLVLVMDGLCGTMMMMKQLLRVQKRRIKTCWIGLSSTSSENCFHHQKMPVIDLQLIFLVANKYYLLLKRANFMYKMCPKRPNHHDTKIIISHQNITSISLIITILQLPKKKIQHRQKLHYAA